MRHYSRSREALVKAVFEQALRGGQQRLDRARAPEGHGASLEEALRALLSRLVAGWTRGNDENVRAYRPAG